MSLPSPDFLLLNYRSDLDLLTLRWMRLVTLEEMRQGYELMLEMAAAHGCRQWLVDVRRRTNTNREGAAWMLGDFVPRVQQRLGGRPALAYLLAPVSLRDVAADAAFPPLSYFDDKPYVAERFIEEGPAVEWLLQFRPVAPAPRPAAR